MVVKTTFANLTKKHINGFYCSHEWIFFSYDIFGSLLSRNSVCKILPYFIHFRKLLNKTKNAQEWKWIFQVLTFAEVNDKFESISSISSSVVKEFLVIEHMLSCLMLIPVYLWPLWQSYKLTSNTIVTPPVIYLLRKY